MTIGATGFAWYHRDDYSRILDIMADADQLPSSYDEWLARAEAGERELKSQGADVVRAVIKPEPFAGWCAVRGLKLDSTARSRFGSEVAEIALGTRDIRTGQATKSAKQA